MTRHDLQRQQGVVLIFSLVFLLLLSMVGLATLRTATDQENLAGNLQDRMLAFQAAEAALRGGERAVMQQPNTVALWQRNTIAWRDRQWWLAHGYSYPVIETADGAPAPQLSSTPRYAVEYLGFVADPTPSGTPPDTGFYFYRITARATGRNTHTVAIVQSTLARHDDAPSGTNGPAKSITIPAGSLPDRPGRQSWHQLR